MNKASSVNEQLIQVHLLG